MPSAMLFVFSALLLTSCRQEMANQPRYDPLESSDYFPNGSSARPLPVGVVSHKQEAVFDGRIDSSLMQRGRERYNIYCSPCHDYTGSGNGMAAVRGFQRKPPSFHSDELRAAKPELFVDVMVNGFGAMPPYANQIDVRDRWAIAAYIRALQLSQAATIADVPAEERQRLDAEKDK